MFWGLAINGAAFVALGLAPSYAAALLCLVIAGLAGGAYHPPATALLTGLYPERQGRAIGLAGMGAGAGFFIGPFYGGLRGEVAGWRAPCLELGLAGLAVAILFALLPGMPPRQSRRRRPGRCSGLFRLIERGPRVARFRAPGSPPSRRSSCPRRMASRGPPGSRVDRFPPWQQPFFGAASDGRAASGGRGLPAAGLGALASWLPKLVFLNSPLVGFFLLALPDQGRDERRCCRSDPWPRVWCLSDQRDCSACPLPG